MNGENDVVRFVTELPPDGRKRRGRTGVRAAWKLALMERPGEWAALPVKVTRNRGRDPGFETVARGGVIYGRYVGGGDS